MKWGASGKCLQHRDRKENAKRYQIQITSLIHAREKISNFHFYKLSIVFYRSIDLVHVGYKSCFLQK